jgi:2'-5' RNA ligase
MTRTFIALEMNEHVQRHLEGVIRRVARLLPSVRWVDPKSIHLTLAFLGELDDAQLADAISATEQAAQQIRAFDYSLSRIGTIGNPRSPHVLWVGIDEPTGHLNRLHSLVHHELSQRGFEIDKRPFSPHLTLARLKNPLPQVEQQRLQQLLEGKQQNLVPTERYHVGRIHVMKSELSQTGAIYTSLRACSLLMN